MVYFYFKNTSWVLRAQYRHSTIPVKYAVGFDSECPENLDDVFVDVHLQMKFSYLHLKEENEAIQWCPLLTSLAIQHLISTTWQLPRRFEGQKRIGNGTVSKHIVNQWSHGNLWPRIKYVFLVKLKHQPSHKNCCLRELLLNRLIPAELPVSPFDYSCQTCSWIWFRM